MSIAEIDEADFGLWKHHPVSKVVLQYIADKREFIEKSTLSQWINGNLSLQADQTLRGQIIELFEMENLKFEALQAFYEEFNATETNQDVQR